MKQVLIAIILALSFSSFPFFAQAKTTVTLDDRLQAQWLCYEKARQALLSRVQDTSRPFGERAISRTDWEQLIGQHLKDSDLKLLRARQLARIKTARARARTASIFDLAKVRDKKLTTDFCR